MNSPRLGGRLGSVGERIEHELLQGPQPALGRSILFIGLVLGLIWVSLYCLRPEYPWLNGRFLAGAVVFAIWGVADLLPYGLREMTVVLRATAWIFMLCLGVWLLTGLFL